MASATLAKEFANVGEAQFTRDPGREDALESGLPFIATVLSYMFGFLRLNECGGESAFLFNDPSGRASEIL